MKRFVCYTLEGLIEQGGQQVWVTVATVSDPDLAAHIQPGEEYLQTRLLPYYRDTPSYTTTLRVDEKRHLPAPVALPIAPITPYVSA